MHIYIYIHVCMYFLQLLAWLLTWQHLLKITPLLWLPGSCRTASMASSQSLLSRQNTLVQHRWSAFWRSMQRTSWLERCHTAMYSTALHNHLWLSSYLLIVVMKCFVFVLFICQDYKCCQGKRPTVPHKDQNLWLEILSLTLNDFVFLGRSWYPVPCDSQSLGDNCILSPYHPLRCTPCRLLECAHISRSW